MVKVILKTVEDLQVDLFSEHIPLREVLCQWYVDYGRSVIVVNNQRMQKNDLDKTLRELCNDAVIQIASIPKVEESTEEMSITTKICFDEDQIRGLYNAMSSLKDIVETIMKMVENAYPDVVSPF